MSPPPPFNRFLDDHREAVYRFLVATVGPDEADDCFQETFIKALRAYPRLRDADNLRGWVLTIARRTAIDAARGRRRRPQPAADPEPPAVDGTPDLGDPALWEAVRGLPPRQRAAVTLRYINDLSYADVGRVIGSSEDAARRSAFEGLRRLREVWDER
ncbi:MAG TPA: RNA polymerase sigma factor [Miltoncostaeaceae bacterium]|jgi:RNA polymerase sigma factor (sigma-70 family)|nr:RNA polymerase sigma factor [Miltoncostaeaceae bacterium]